MCSVSALAWHGNGMAADSELPKEVKVTQGRINSVTIDRDGKKLVVYGSDEKIKNTEWVLLTQARRQLVDFARGVAGDGAKVVAHAEVQDLIQEPEKFWTDFWKDRFNYYKQQVTKVPISGLPIAKAVKDGEALDWQGLKIQVVDTPGYTRNGVSYLVEMDGKRVMFTGELIRAGGKIADIYSFQDAIPDAKVGGYHGHGGRFGLWVESLLKVAALKPDVMVPSRGAVILDPQKDIKTAIDRVQAVYRNYQSTNALNWYFKEDRLKICAEKVLGEGATFELMPYSEHIDLPEWCKHIGTTKLLVSDDGHGFALDVGSPKMMETLKQAIEDGLVKSIEGIFATHAHNDHTAAIAAAAKEFNCPVYTVKEVADVLEKPGAWFLPGVTENVVDKVAVKKDGEKMKWRGFELTFNFYPGQMYNHAALLAEKPGHDPVFFIGDSFSPSGIDDYCLMNRNLMREDTGYLYCFKKVRELPKGSWLVNQHIPHLFRFTDTEMEYLEGRYKERVKMLEELIAWDDVNYGIDEQWAWFYPYGCEAKAGDAVELEIRFWNHSKQQRTFEVELNYDGILEDVTPLESITLKGRTNGVVKVRGKMAAGVKPGIHVVTADIKSEGMDLRQWCEALVRVE